MQASRRSHLQYRIQHIIFIILLLACIGFAGWLSNTYNHRSDWTAGARHSLSSDTLAILEQLPLPVELRSYQANNPALTNAINEILSRYKTKKSDFNYQLINPDIFIEQAKADNIKRYGQTIIEYNGQIERIEKISEQNISNALIRLQRGSSPQILFLTQHGERSIHDSSASGYNQLAQQLLNKGFKVNSINLIKDNLNTSNNILVLGSIKKPLLESEQQKIQTFIKNGGQLLWLQDPSAHASQLNIAADLNIHFVNGVVIDNNQEVNAMLSLSHPAIIPILEYRRHPITDKMQYFTLFTSATAIITNEIQTNTPNNWISTDLLITSANSWSESKDLNEKVEFNQQDDFAGPLSIGIAQQRQRETSQEKLSQRVVIIGDSDFIANNNIGQGANLDFILNTFNWLTSNDKLISIAPKNAPDLQLNLSAPIAALIGLIFLIFLPLVFFISGAAIWFKRHKK